MAPFLIVAAVLGGAPSERLLADYRQQPPAEQPYIRYLSLEHVPRSQRASWEATLRFVVCSASREVVIERQAPVRLGSSATYRIHLRSLGWDWRNFNKVLERYPYAENHPQRPLIVIRGDWLVNELSDTTESDAYYRLLYGGDSIPKTRDEFLKFWKVDQKAQAGFEFGLIEERSGVSKQKVRWIEHCATAVGGYAWGTRDTLEVSEGKDPLAAPDGDFQHDGEEWIVGAPKVSLRDRTRGYLQMYLLANGQGQRVEEAPVDLVEDYTRFKGQAAIKTAGSCIQCHAGGLNEPTQNGLQSLLLEGVELYSKFHDKQEAIERFHFSDVAKEIRRNNEDYALAVKACNGLSPEANSAAYRAAIRSYNADVSLTRAANELRCKPDELKLALAYASANKIDVGVRLASLAHGRAVPRTAFEADYRRAEALLSVWKRKR